MICIPILSRNQDEALRKMERASPLADVIEIRLDTMESFDLRGMVESSLKPVLVTYRSRKEGGLGSADHETVVRYLTLALEAGAAFVDLEYGLPPGTRKRILRDRGESRVVLSSHLPDGTPSREKLEALLRDMVATGADIVKIVTRATRPEDNLRVLELIPAAKNLNAQIIAFCMGPLGRISRIACTVLGGTLTFAALEEGEESAEGQIPAKEMRRMLENLG